MYYTASCSSLIFESGMDNYVFKCQGIYYMGPVMRKHAFAICEQQRRRSACVSAQSDQRLCYSLLRWYNTSSF